MRTRILTLAGATLFAAVTLTACSSAPAEPAEQTVAEACTVAFDTVSSVQGDLTDVTGSITSGDFAAVTTSLGSLSAALAEATDAVSNGVVKEQLTALGESVQGFAALFDGVEDGDVTALAAKSTEIQAASAQVTDGFTAMGDICD